MTVIERIKETAREKKNISLTVLEQELHYSNGSLAKAKDIPSSRIMEIAHYLDVSMDFIMTGKEYNPYSKESAHLVSKIRKDAELVKTLEKYFTMSDDKKKHVIDTINMMSEE